MPLAEGISTASDIATIGYAMVAVTSTFAMARIAAHLIAPRKIAIEDGLVVLAYASNIAMCSLYISLAPIQTKMIPVSLGLVAPYPSIADDGVFLSRCYFASLMIFYLILWMVKFAFLVLYRKLFLGLRKAYTWVWWAIFALCVATLIASLAIYLSPCDDIRTLVDGGPSCKLTAAHQIFTVLFSYSADTLTNILIMALPMRLAWNLQMPRSKKIGVILIFGTAIVCIVVATVRAAQVTYNINKAPSSWTSSKWLAIWGMAEASTAVIIGFSPAFATLIRAAVSKGISQARGYYPQGYQKQPPSRSGAHSRSAEFPLTTVISDMRKGVSKGLGTAESFYDGASSQENLAPGRKDESIRVTITLA